MSKLSRKFKVPDELANLYEFANSLDLRRFTHHGIQHPQSDQFAGPMELAEWMAERDLLAPGAKITTTALEAALKLRSAVRDYLALDPDGRRGKAAMRAVNEAIGAFPLVARLNAEHGAVLHAARSDALAGLSVIVGEFYDGSRDGSLDRLKMCASEECRRVFFDRSKPATRRWCMSTLCGNRMKTRAYRERHRSIG